jgi:predicted ribosomally synthesized peptide with nif11-like leader
MSLENVKEFFKKLETDEDFRKIITDIERKHTNDRISMLEAISEQGFIFNDEDFIEYTNQQRELSDNELESVSGGWGCYRCYYYGVNPHSN